MFRNKKRILTAILCLVMGVMIWTSSTTLSFALGTAKVVAASGKIREKAGTGSNVLASVKKDDSLDVISQTSDSDGYTWYKVYVDSEKEGYIRADLVSVSGTIPSEKENTDSTTASDSAQSSSGGNKTVVGSNNSTSSEKKDTSAESVSETSAVSVEETDVVGAKVKEKVRVRKGAGTTFDVAGNAAADTAVTVSGVATDGEGKSWYQISFNEGDKTVNGFIREDFLEITERVEEIPVEEVIEEEEEPVVVNEDYQLEYRQNDAGEMDWYLKDNIQGTSQSLTQLLNVVEQTKENALKENTQISIMRILIFVLAALVVILIVTVTILAFKLRDARDYDYEDHDDEDEEEENEDDEDEDEEEEEEELPSKFGRRSFFGRKKSDQEEEDEEEDDGDEGEEITEVKPVKSQTEKKSWQSKDFLELDDDMEFEFLDL